MWFKANYKNISLIYVYVFQQLCCLVQSTGRSVGYTPIRKWVDQWSKKKNNIFPTVPGKIVRLLNDSMSLIGKQRINGLCFKWVHLVMHYFFWIVTITQIIIFNLLLYPTPLHSSVLRFLDRNYILKYIDSRLKKHDYF